MQSEKWRKFQESLGKPVFEDSGDGWSFLATLESTPLGKYLYLPYGPTIRDEKAFAGALKALQGLAKAKDAVFIRIEPTSGIEAATLAKAGFKKIDSLNPEHTWVLDLSPSEADILAGMKQNNRNLFNNYRKKGLAVHHTTDPEKAFYLTSLLSGVAAHNGINVHPLEYFKKQMSQAGAVLYYVTLALPPTPPPSSPASTERSAQSDISMSAKADGDSVTLASPSVLSSKDSSSGREWESTPNPSENKEELGRENKNGASEGDIKSGQVIAAALIYDSPTTRYYAHAAADYEHRKLSAGTVLVAQLIVDAKKKGLKTFDFYGITVSSDPHHPWYGLTKFKQSFGGAPLTYLGDWDLPIKKARYRAFTHLRAANRRLRKITTKRK